MVMEEDQFFPCAEATLEPDDWTDIDARGASETDPLFDRETGVAFAALTDDILKWEEEDESRQR